MKLETQFELFRWIYFVLIWFIGMGVIVSIGEFLAGPFIGWLLHEIPYQLPTWDRAKRWALGIVFIGIFAGTLSWYAEKRNCGR